MPLSKTTRICILLAIDSAFFILELVSGYAVHSLALVADSFHMLNDVLSLLVGLWAVRVANSTSSEQTFTYGYQRAETLGALINGVFLVALCLSIFLEAIQRFVEPQEVTHPKLVLIVGCFGLASNIIGLFLFHEHGHSHGHGDDEHSHEHTDEITAAEEGHATLEQDAARVADERGKVADIMPENRVITWSQTSYSPRKRAKTFDVNSEHDPLEPTGSLAHRRSEQWRRSSRSRSRAYSGIEDVPVHPASLRKSIVLAANMGGSDSEESSHGQTDENETAVEEEGEDEQEYTEISPLLKQHANRFARPSHGHDHDHASKTPNGHGHSHTPLGKSRSRDPNRKKNTGHGHGGHGGHSHGDLNMRGVFLHVMGDALGNIGVIASALFIWLTKFTWRFYADPAISLIITVIILCSAIPLCKAASRILLQAAPAHLSMDDVKADIESLPGILSCHHLHVWQLSGDSNLVASLHVQVEFDFKGEGSKRYMELARQIRATLRQYSIQSSTIQPEFCLDPNHMHSVEEGDEGEQTGGIGTSSSATLTASAAPGSVNGKSSKASSLRGQCILDCEEADAGQKCCGRKRPEGDS